MFKLERAAECRASRDDTLRYAGYDGQKLDDSMANMLDQALAKAELLAHPAWCFQVFPATFEAHASELVLNDSIVRIPVQPPNQAFALADSAAILACTIGLSFDRDLAALGITDGTLAFLCDTAASSLVENACDECERSIGEYARDNGLFAGQRYSPGYTGLPLGLSRDFIGAIKADRNLGISVTDSGMLVPLKSVTAIVPLFEHEQDALQARRSCAGCINLDSCRFLKSGRACYERG